MILAIYAALRETSAMIERLKRNIDNYNTTSIHKHKLSISLGKAYYYHDKTATLESLLDIADKDMYANKDVKKS